MAYNGLLVEDAEKAARNREMVANGEKAKKYNANIGIDPRYIAYTGVSLSEADMMYDREVRDGTAE